MPEFRKALDVVQGFNFKKDKQSAIGYITKLKIGTNTFDADLTVKDPLKPDTDLKVVAVLNHILWETGVTDAIYGSGQVSVASRQAIATLVYTQMTDVGVEFQFDVYEYDPLKKKYFKAFSANAKDLKGLVEKKGDDLNLAVADEPSDEVQSPENYPFTVGIKPQPEAQSLTLATGDGKNFAKAWGLTVGK